MTTGRIMTGPARPDWQRIAALAATALAHACAVLVLAMPLVMRTERARPVVAQASLLSEPTPPVPLPADPQPPVRQQRSTPPVPVPVRHSTPVEPPVREAPHASTRVDTGMPATPSNEATGAPDAGADDVGSPAGGASRVLAYATAPTLRYPPLAMRLREEGRVVLSVLVDADGRAQRIEIARSSGHASLDAAAREAVERTRFQPVLRDGRAVPAWGIVPIEFRLSRG